MLHSAPDLILAKRRVQIDQVAGLNELEVDGVVAINSSPEEVVVVLESSLGHVGVVEEHAIAIDKAVDSVLLTAVGTLPVEEARIRVET